MATTSVAVGQARIGIERFSKILDQGKNRIDTSFGSANPRTTSAVLTSDDGMGHAR